MLNDNIFPAKVDAGAGANSGIPLLFWKNVRFENSFFKGKFLKNGQYQSQSRISEAVFIFQRYSRQLFYFIKFFRRFFLQLNFFLGFLLQ
jgi:hypothetical protein